MINAQLTSAGALVLYKLQDPKDLLALSKCVSGDLEKQVISLESVYYPVDVSKALSNLSQIASLLRLAYAGTKGQKSAPKVTAICADYQTMVKDTRLACAIFVRSSLKAIQLHQLAYKLVEKKELKGAFKLLSKCAEVAHGMAVTSERLCKQSENLCSLAKDAWISATEDETNASEKRKELDKQLADIKAQEESLKSKKGDLTQEVEDAKEREKALEKRADTAQSQALTMGIISGLMGPLTSLVAVAGKVASVFIPNPAVKGVVGVASEGIEQAVVEAQKASSSLKSEIEILRNELTQKKDLLKEEKKNPDGGNVQKIGEIEEKIREIELKIQTKEQSFKEAKEAFEKLSQALFGRASDYSEQQEKAAKLRAELQKDQREVNAKLAESVQRLKDASSEKNELATSIVSLEIAVKTLAKVKTVFENARLFWSSVEAQCKSLGDLTEIQVVSELELTEEICPLISGSLLSWAVLGSVTARATDKMGEIDKGVDKMFENLPTMSEAPALIESSANTLQIELEAENLLLKDQ